MFKLILIALVALLNIGLIKSDCGEPGLSSVQQVVHNLRSNKKYPADSVVEYECDNIGKVSRTCVKGSYWSGEIPKCPSKLETKVSARIPKQRAINLIWNGNVKVLAVKIFVQSRIASLREFEEKTQLVQANGLGSEVDVVRMEDERLNKNNDIKRHSILIKRTNLNTKGIMPTSIINLEFNVLNVDRKCDLADRDGAPSLTSLFGGSLSNCIRADLTEVYYLDPNGNYCFMADIPGHIESMNMTNMGLTGLRATYACEPGYELVSPNLRENQCVSGQDWLYYGPLCVNRTEMASSGQSLTTAFGPLPFQVANEMRLELASLVADMEKLQFRLAGVYERIRNATEFSF
jgi:hypothetical protein